MPFDELADPVALADLAIGAETHGWNGLFLWDHIVYRHPVRAVADPWVALNAIAARGSRLGEAPELHQRLRRGGMVAGQGWTLLACPNCARPCRSLYPILRLIVQSGAGSPCPRMSGCDPRRPRRSSHIRT